MQIGVAGESWKRLWHPPTSCCFLLCPGQPFIWQRQLQKLTVATCSGEGWVPLSANKGHTTSASWKLKAGRRKRKRKSSEQQIMMKGNECKAAANDVGDLEDEHNPGGGQQEITFVALCSLPDFGRACPSLFLYFFFLWNVNRCSWSGFP